MWITWGGVSGYHSLPPPQLVRPHVPVSADTTVAVQPPALTLVLHESLHWYVQKRKCDATNVPLTFALIHLFMWSCIKSC